jgi:LPS sulfotransferase NodH
MFAPFVKRFTSAAHDVPERHEPPRASCVVSSTPRSGSSLFSLALADTGLLGCPLEYQNPLVRGPLAERWGCGPELTSYVPELHRRRTGSNGIFGIHLHWFQLMELLDEALGPQTEAGPYAVDATGLDFIAPRPRWVHLMRRDVDAQAVSLFVAMRSGRWAVDAGTSGGTPTPEYSFAAIDSFRRYLEHGELCWQRFFQFNGIDPVVVVYEDLLENFAGTIESVVALVADGAAAPRVTPRLEMQRSDATRAYRDRYVAERAQRWAHDPVAAEVTA